MSPSMDEEPILQISLVADSYCRNVGDDVMLQIQVRLLQPLENWRLRVALPPVFEVESARTQKPLALLAHDIGTLGDGGSEVEWNISRLPSAETKLEFCVTARVRHSFTASFQRFIADQNIHLDPERALYVDCEALVDSIQDGEYRILAGDRTRIAVRITSAYANHLPSLYRQDANGLIGRFLMCTEDLWKPIEQWIDHVDQQFDPLLAPEDALPWLASWGNESLDDRWSHPAQRGLLNQHLWLRRIRGTSLALEAHIQHYTGFKPKIVEHRSSRLQIGTDAVLGRGLVLGSTKTPHTFSVFATVDAGQSDEAMEQHRLVIEEIINKEKPAYAKLEKLIVMVPQSQTDQQEGATT